jgi:hypothetical protein
MPPPPLLRGAAEASPAGGAAAAAVAATGPSGSAGAAAAAPGSVGGAAAAAVSAAQLCARGAAQHARARGQQTRSACTRKGPNSGARSTAAAEHAPRARGLRRSHNDVAHGVRCDVSAAASPALRGDRGPSERASHERRNARNQRATAARTQRAHARAAHTARGAHLAGCGSGAKGRSRLGAQQIRPDCRRDCLNSRCARPDVAARKKHARQGRQARGAGETDVLHCARPWRLRSKRTRIRIPRARERAFFIKNVAASPQMARLHARRCACAACSSFTRRRAAPAASAAPIRPR